MEASSTQPAPNGAEKESPIDTSRDATEEETYLTGSKLYLVLLAVTLAGYITTLDSSIVATVC